MEHRALSHAAGSGLGSQRLIVPMRGLFHLNPIHPPTRTGFRFDFGPLSSIGFRNRGNRRRPGDRASSPFRQGEVPR
eukprot:126520-Prymnesium_polylepis.1